MDDQIVLALQLRSRGDRERLFKRVIARRLEAQRLELLLDVVLGAVNAFGPGAAAFHVWRGKNLDVVEVALRIGDWSIRKGVDRQQYCNQGKSAKMTDSHRRRG